MCSPTDLLILSVNNPQETLAHELDEMWDRLEFQHFSVEWNGVCPMQRIVTHRLLRN